MTLHTKQSRLKTGSVATASALTEKGQREREREREGAADGGIRSQIERGLLGRLPPKLNQEGKGRKE